MKCSEGKTKAVLMLAALQAAVLIAVFVFQSLSFRRAPLFELPATLSSGDRLRTVEAFAMLPAEGPGAVSGICWNAFMDGSEADTPEQLKKTVRCSRTVWLTEPRPRMHATDLSLVHDGYLYFGDERQPQVASFWKLQASGRRTLVRAAAIGSAEDAARDGEWRLIIDAALDSDGVVSETLPPSLAWVSEAAKKADSEVLYTPRKKLRVRLALPQSDFWTRHANASYKWHDRASFDRLMEMWLDLDRLPEPEDGAERGVRAVLALPNGNPSRAFVVDLLVNGRPLKEAVAALRADER